ncbi:hypothetical protein ACTHHL_07805 [Aeribacillus composti]|uniref:hypothetical protein n=1 Tax=Aeribacillus TaxID=1055323 RepID=UPI0030F7BB9C
MKFYTKLVVSLLCLTLFTSMSRSSFAEAKANDTQSELGLTSELDQEFINDSDIEEGLEDALKVLSAIESLPYNVISEGPEAIVEWLNNLANRTFELIEPVYIRYTFRHR